MTEENKELVLLVQNSGIEKTKAQSVLDAFIGFFNEAAEWEAKAKALIITDISQTHEMKMAREGRLQLKEIRVAAEKTKKKLKENILLEGRFIDSIYNLIEGVIKPIENDLLEKEKFVERKEQARKEAIKNARLEKLAPYNIDTSFYNLAEMPDNVFEQLLENTRTAYEAKLEAERKAEAERIAREKAEQEERIRIAAENARLKAEAEAKEKAIAAERRAREEAERIEREKHEAALRAEREAAEKARKELEARIAAENAAKQLEAERIAAEQKAREEAERKLAAASDKEKTLAYIRQLGLVPIPIITNDQFEVILKSLRLAISNAEAKARSL